MTPITTRARRLGAVLAIAVAGATPASAWALGPVDQQQPAQDSAIVMPPGIAQTFTVGRSGMLDGLSLTSPGGGTINYQLYAVRPDGTPDVTRPLLAKNAQAALFPGVTATIPLPAPVPVVAGQRIALGVGTIRSTATLALATAAGDPYPAGDLFQVISISSFTPVTGVDLQFSTTVTSVWATTLALRTLASTGGTPTAVLTYSSPAVPLSGRAVTFDLLRATGAVKATCTATTDAAGTAACAKVRWQIPSGGSLRATFTGDATYLSSTASVTG